MEKSHHHHLGGLAHRIIADGLMSENALTEAIAFSQNNNISLLTHLVQNQLVNPATLAHAIAHDFGLPLLDLAAFDSSLIPFGLLSKKLIRQYHVLPLLKTGDTLYIAVSDPTDQHALEQIKFFTGLRISSVLVEENKLAKLIESHLSLEEGVELQGLTSSLLEDLEINVAEETKNIGTDDTGEDAPIIRFVHKLLLDAVNKKASDVHFEPYEKFYRVRFRIDGMLYEVAQPPSNLSNRITARLKVMSRLDISERRVPQDGRFKMTLSKHHNIDFRVSTCPTAHGEKVVARILDSSNTILDVEALGFEPAQMIHFSKYIKQPQGMILVTGPTGSGKTITLYTALNILNTPLANISTVEDPVEIHLPGINQVNINTKADLTFSRALRAFLRQDPDIIMVGEMRDLETAEIGIKAAQTGHLVLSTLHTNSAPETLTRLANMGVPAYNIATSCSLIIAQRLARKLCQYCKQLENIPLNILREEGFSDDNDYKIYGAAGCERCTLGYKGRVGLFEVLPVSDAIKQIIMSGGSSLDIAKQARAEGMISLRESGLLKIANGLTSLEEINRVTKD